jgi:anti-sigma factor ChrR (cupin superfamily)
MKKFMMKYLMISCREATYLMAKKEEGKLSFAGRIKLSIHTSMCSMCRKFEKQTSQIGKESRHVHAEDHLPAFAKEKIERMLDEHSG